MTIIEDMATHAGIHCSQCSRVHFVAALKRIAETTTKGVYQITCVPPCAAVTFFRLDEMRAFTVADRVFERGYADPGEYEAAPRRSPAVVAK